MIASEEYELVKAMKTASVPSMVFKTSDDTKHIQLDAGDNSKTTILPTSV
jgi:hypothetical protein